MVHAVRLRWRGCREGVVVCAAAESATGLLASQGTKPSTSCAAPGDTHTPRTEFGRPSMHTNPQHCNPTCCKTRGAARARRGSCARGLGHVKGQRGCSARRRRPARPVSLPALNPAHCPIAAADERRGQTSRASSRVWPLSPYVLASDTPYIVGNPQLCFQHACRPLCFSTTRLIGTVLCIQKERGWQLAAGCCGARSGAGSEGESPPVPGSPACA
jgi:hypothetical protein